MKLADNEVAESPLSGLPPVPEDEDLDESDSEDIENTKVAQAQQRRHAREREVFNKHLQAAAGKSPKDEFDLGFTSKTSERSQPIIDNPRDYQNELFERAKRDNVIAVLDTGSGKTLIAALLMRHIATQELQDRAEGRTPRISFFLVNSVLLVIQQQRMLKTNLAFSSAPAALHGGTNADLWKRAEWQKLKQDYRAVVCTAEVLNQCLMHSFVKINEINLLIFDEAHHTKKGHPYARIIKDYYLAESDEERRPKIFGMTASPVNCNTDIDKAAYNLETLLHAKIVTAKSMSLSEYSPKPIDEDWVYEEPTRPFETDFYSKLQAVKHIKALKTSFIFAKEASASLGRWCSDRVWYYALSENESRNILVRFEKTEEYQQFETVEEKAHARDMIRDAAMLAKSQQIHSLQPTHDSLSHKVMLLHQKLLGFYQQNERTRCIVFVDQRLTARILADCFALLRIPNLRPGILIGVGGSTFSVQADTWKQHQDTMDEFRAGTTNCVFATSVAEEGLDIPECNLIVCFDLYRTLIQYMQRRGRARAKNSVFANMTEQGRHADAAIVDYVKDAEKYLRGFCERLPEDRLLGKGLERLLLKEKPPKSFVTKAGAKCNFYNSPLILARYASSLQHETGSVSHFSFEEDFNCEEKMFRFRTVLPELQGFDGAWGGEYPNRLLAKRSAAWETCFALRSTNMLDQNLDSVHQKKRPENANAHLAINNQLAEYDMKIKPDFWSTQWGQTPEILFPVIIHLSPSIPLFKRHAPLMMLTRSLLPDVPDFPVYLEGDNETMVHFEHGEAPLHITEAVLAQLTSFTLTIFADVFNKTYRREVDQMSYWLAPILEQKPIHGFFNPGDALDLDLMTKICAADGQRPSWTKGGPIEPWLDQFLVDKWSGGQRFFSRHVLPGKPIESPIPAGVKRRLKGSPTILEYSLNFYGKWRAKWLQDCDRDQPVVAAELVHLRRNFLDKMTGPERAFTTYVEVVPEPMQMSLLGPNIARTSLVFPAVMSRLDSYLIAIEGFKKVGLNVPANLALEAFTKDSDNTEETKEQQIHVQRGMGKNYERLEFIGDSLLKMTTTIMCYIRCPKSDEFGFHTRRMSMLCNANLFNVATEPAMNLPLYVRSRAFNRRTWYPEGLVLESGKGKGDLPIDYGIGKHSIGKKTVADVSEAIIGASLLATKTDHCKTKFDLGIRAITKLVKNEDHNISSWDDFAREYNPPQWQLDDRDPIANDLARMIEQSMGYKFRYPRLLRSAFTHSSDQHTTVPDYQRLEFLGDAVLDMVCINWLFNKFEDRNPQWLTEHKMPMVSNKFLGAVAVVLGFDKLINASTVKLMGDIANYSEKVRNATADGLKNSPRDFWVDMPDAPKALSDLVESYLGALIIDSGFDYGRAERFFEEHVYWFFEDIALYDSFANKHPTTFLHQRMAELGCMDFKLLHSDPPDGPVDVRITAGVVVHNDCYAMAESSSPRYAKVRAAEKMIQLLEGMTAQEFRKKFQCNCRGEVEDDDGAVVELTNELATKI